MLSTRDLSELPDIESLRKRLQQMAALESVYAIDFGTASYDFQPNWTGSQQLGVYKDGSGDELFIHFLRAGCFIKGFAHESVMSPYKKKPPALWPGLLSSVPEEFNVSLKEPAFDIAATTFAIWRRAADHEWHTDVIEFPSHDDADGSEDLLAHAVMSASDFAEWLAENYETQVDATVVAGVFQNHPLNDAQLRRLNPSASIAEMRKAVEQTGYALSN
ncbi:MAG TPA: hypothetical protein VF278_25135 [Pirellulales bacterium]